ncbi:ABC transporter [Erysipelothrix larvae]|uniref:ABC transporter n=1 Tax=Erysipelothrix larvae TaxID=1514105 RepID=A0A0X8H178_9FIRM|nr:sugar ABC transporter ATP-binding protein [Erysipelothrix larvae]AMC93974.1 ABC transporter [Erysipelothrix larvae]
MKITFDNIVKQFGATQALKGVSFSVQQGSILGLLGENGAGKSTLMNILGGVFAPTSGTIEIDGKRYTSLNTDETFKLGISFIHQELNLVNDLKVYENLFLNHELTKMGLLDKKEMIKRSKDVFKRMKIDIDPEAFVKDIDTSRKQLVEIAKALLYESRVIIFDEPTTALTDKEIKILFELMRNFKEDNISCIYISHKMPEIFEICDDYVVLRDGTFIQEGKIHEINEKIATELLVGKAMNHDQSYVSKGVQDAVIFKVEGLSAKPYFNNISFDVKKGEVVSITGLFGDGRGELSEALFGARAIDSGRIEINGEQIGKITIPKMIKNGVSMVPRDRKDRSVIKDMNISDNLSIPYYRFRHHKRLISSSIEKQRFERNKEIFSIKAESHKAGITSLSGGNQQKVIFARWFELDNDLYILDNPTQGIDVGAKGEIYELISKIADEGKSIIVFSSEIPEIQKISHRCIVMYRGEINRILHEDDITEMNVMYYSTGANKKENQDVKN